MKIPQWYVYDDEVMSIEQFKYQDNFKYLLKAPPKLTWRTEDSTQLGIWNSSLISGLALLLEF